MLINKQRLHFYGLFLILLFVILSAGKEVCIGNLVQKIDPFFLNSFCFILVTLAFYLKIFFKAKHRFSFSASLRKNASNFIFLNISTMLFWTSSFFGLQYLEPSIGHSISTAIGPIITMFWLYVKEKQRLQFSEVTIAFFILGIILYMSIISLLGKTGIGHISLHNVLYGIIAFFVAGGSIVGNTIFSKKLGKANVPADFVLAGRFYLLILVSFSLFLFTNAEFQFNIIIEEFPRVILLTFFGIAIPLFILQKGIEKTDPLSTSYIILIGPIFTYIFQIFDSRLVPSSTSLLSISLVIVLVLYLVKKRYYSSIQRVS